MTRFLLVLLFTYPLLAHGQATATKESSLVALSESSPLPMALPSPSSASSPTSTAANLVESSRVVPPKLIHAILMKDNGNRHVHLAGRRRVVMVELTVNERGEPADLRIPAPVESALDAEVLATVGRFRYEPGTLNGKPFPMPVQVRCVVPVGAIY